MEDDLDIDHFDLIFESKKNTPTTPMSERSKRMERRREKMELTKKSIIDGDDEEDVQEKMIKEEDKEEDEEEIEEEKEKRERSSKKKKKKEKKKKKKKKESIEKLKMKEDDEESEDEENEKQKEDGKEEEKGKGKKIVNVNEDSKKKKVLTKNAIDRIERRNSNPGLNESKFIISRTPSIDGGTLNDQWSEEQLEALTLARWKILPSIPNYWQEVAKFVPNKTGEQCFQKVFGDHQIKPLVKKEKKSQKEQEKPFKIAAKGTIKRRTQLRELLQSESHEADIFETSPFKKRQRHFQVTSVSNNLNEKFEKASKGPKNKKQKNEEIEKEEIKELDDNERSPEILKPFDQLANDKYVHNLLKIKKARNLS